MCRLLFGADVKGSLIRKFFETSFALGNKDGYMFYGGDTVVRTMEWGDVYSFIHPEKSYSRVISHARFASSGGISLGGVHGWFHGDWVFAHNGVVKAYASSENVDSYIFFRMLSPLLEKKDSVKIGYLIEEVGFQGVAYAYNAITDTLMVAATVSHYFAVLPGSGYVLSSKADVLLAMDLDPVRLSPEVRFLMGVGDSGDVLKSLLGGEAGDAKF